MNYVAGSNALVLEDEIEEKFYDNYDRAELIWENQKVQYGIDEATYDYPPEFLEEINSIIEKLDGFTAKCQDKLKVKNAKKVSYFLWDWLNEYVSDHNLCPGCYHELEWQDIRSNDWFEPDSARKYCDCGYEECV